VWICSGVNPLTLTSLIRGNEMLPSGRTATVWVTSGSFHTLMCRTSESPTRYSGGTLAVAEDEDAASPALRSAAFTFALCGCPQAKALNVQATDTRLIVNFFTFIFRSQLACSQPLLFGSFAQKNHFDGFEEDGHIQRDGKVLDVEEIQLQLS